MPETADKNTLVGVYQNDCCGREIVISVGAEFPACPKHPHRNIAWTQIEIELAEVTDEKKAQSASAA